MNNTQQHTLESCPLNPFGCITTTATAPYRILDLDLGALDLFLSGYEYDRHHRDQLHSARSKTLEFLRGLNVADVLLPDTESCLLLSPSTTTTTTTATIASKTDAVQSYIISEDAILSHSQNRNSPYSNLKRSSTARRVHACIHHSPSTPTSRPNHNSFGSTKSPSTGCRYYLVKDVTEMHDLAIAARNGIRASGRLAQPQQSPAALSRTSTTSTKRQQHLEGQTPKKSAYTTLLRSRDSGIMLDDQYWHRNSNSDNSINTNTNTETSTASDVEPPLKTRMKTTIQDPGLLILQVTQFGTIDHAFAIPQSVDAVERWTGWSSPSSSGTSSPVTGDDYSHDDDNKDANTFVFLAQDRVAIEAMASNAVMAYVHPQELSALCKGLDQVCKARYTVFRARWRVDAPASEGMLSDEDDHCSRVYWNDLNSSKEERHCRMIEFQGEWFEEWVDPSSTAMACSQGMTVKREEEREEEEEDDQEGFCKYAWTEVTGVLSNGNVVLVVRPLTMPEVEEQEWFMASSPSVNTSARYQASSSQDSTYSSFAPVPAFLDYTDDANEDEDEDGYLEMEMEMDSLCSEQTLVQDNTESKTEWRALTDEVRKRMDLEEGLCLSKSSGTVVSRLSNLSSPTNSSVLTVSPRSKLDTHVKQQQQQPPCHSNRKTLLITFSPTAAASSLVLVSLPILSSIALDAWRQWIQVIHLTREQFQAWSEYLLDLALGQTIETVSFGMTILGCAPRPYLSAPFLTEYDYYHNNSAESDGAVRQELCQQTTVATIQRSHSSQENKVVNRLSGLNRAGKVLEAHYPGLEGAVRHLGQSWLGHRIMATVQLEEKLDVVADQVVDWWESEDRVAAIVASSVPPLLNTLTAYTPLSFLSRRFVNTRTTSINRKS
ncbi:hypothetical protein EC968_005142 [Mortierella alpina]|nr:hypothetical protein EC968_005142 [Mortierella alpina]